MRAALLVLVALLAAGCAAPAPDATATPAQGADVGPAWAFTGLEGERISRDAPARNATVLFFMASWCGTCRSKAPILADVHADLSPRGLATYSVSFDPTDDKDDLRAWQERYQQAWPHGIDEGLAMQRAFAIRQQSSVVVLDREGSVVERFGYGQVSDEGLRAAVDAALARSAALHGP